MSEQEDIEPGLDILKALFDLDSFQMIALAELHRSSLILKEGDPELEKIRMEMGALVSPEQVEHFLRWEDDGR